MSSIRNRMYRIVESNDGERGIGGFYDYLMIIAIFASLVPLAFKEQSELFMWVERITVILFILDYIARWTTADLKLGKGWKSFIIYPFTPMAIIDLLSILPGVAAFSNDFKLLRLLRLVRLLRAVRLLRYSKSVTIVGNIFRAQKSALLAVCTLALAYVLLCALLIFNVEPDSFDNFFEAVYWATISLTTVGYGDLYPTTDVGRFIAMLSSVMGIAVVALPSGIITAEYIEQLKTFRNEPEDLSKDPAMKERIDEGKEGII